MTHERVYESATLTISSQCPHGHHLGFSNALRYLFRIYSGNCYKRKHLQLQTNSLYCILIGTFLFFPPCSCFTFSVLGSPLTIAGAGKFVAERKYLWVVMAYSPRTIGVSWWPFYFKGTEFGVVPGQDFTLV